MRSPSTLLPTLPVWLAMTLACVASADGPITGRMIVLGRVPEPRPVGPGPDACCQAAAPQNESLVVGPDGGLANVLVSVEPRRGEPKPPQIAPPIGPAVLTNKGCAFAPRVLLARVGQPLTLTNTDATMHNVNIGFVRNPAMNVVIEPQGRRETTLTRPERKPVGVRCNVHAFMQGWVAVREDPFAAVTSPTGDFELPPIPAGDWRLRFWREGAYLAGLPIGDSETDIRGEIVLSVPAAGLDLGVLAAPIKGLPSRDRSPQ